jgi:hypothetical protein
VLVVVGYPESGAQLFRDYYAEYADGRPILVTGGLRDPTLPQNVGNALSEIRGTAPLAAGPGTEFFEREYRREYGSAPGVFTSQAFDATAVCLLANAAAGRNAGPAIAEQMRRVANPGGRVVTPASLADGLVAAARGTDIQYRGASSAIEFDRRGDLRAATYELFGFRPGGGVETIEEIEFST